MSRYPHAMLATCCVPWNEDGSLNETVFRAGIRTLLRHDLRHLYVFGTAGEGHAVSDGQFDEIVDVFAEEMSDPASHPMVGVISSSLTTVIERIERCADKGLTTFQVSLPSWGALGDDELDLFFAETCGRFPDLEFLHYNLGRSLRLVTPAEYAQLAERYPNLVATKNAGANQATTVALMRRAPQLRHFFTEPGFGYASQFGAAGLLLSISCLNPARARLLFEAGRSGDVLTAAALTSELADLVSALVNHVGVTRMDGAYDKCYSKVLDPDFSLRLLPPYIGASEDAFTGFVEAVRASHPQWLPGARGTPD